MKVVFLGAAHEVTGSCTYIKVGSKKGIVDCGMEQGKNIFQNAPLPVAESELDFVLLTHAHIDHSGKLPLLYKNGFRGPVYMSEATASLCAIMLKDSANIQISEAEYKNRKGERKGEPTVEPLYDFEDVDGILSLIHPCPYGKELYIEEGVVIRFTDVGHLLGSSAIELSLTENGQTRKICFSGDVGNINQPIIKDPQHVEYADYLVLESTYGDRLHEKVETDYVKELASRIQKVLDRGGNLIIPSFAVGRTQEMLYFIREIKEKNLVSGHGDFKVVLDSPLAIEATSVFLQCDIDYLDDEMRDLIRSGKNPLVFPGLEFTTSQEESRAINEDKTPKVIISASGMCDAGRVRHHLKHNLWRANSMVLFVGYQAAGTLGRLLVDGLDKVKLFGEEIIVNAEIDTLPGVSGHADRDGLVSWLKGFKEKPGMVFINHGEPETAENFSEYLQADGYKTFTPYSGAEVDLITGEIIKRTEGIPVADEPYKTGKSSKKDNAPDRKSVPAQEAYRDLVSAAEKLLFICQKSEGLSNRILRSAAEEIKNIIRKLL